MSAPESAFDQSVDPDVASGPLPHLGDYLSRGFRVWGRRWQEWLVPMLISGAICLVAWLCCAVPYFLVAGPLACGLYACALRSLREQPFDGATLWSDWGVAGRAMLAHVVFTLVGILPVILLYAVAFGGFALFAVSLEGQGPAGPSEQVAIWGIVVLFLGMAAMTIGGIVVVVALIWFSTKTMFVMPLIVDRRVDFTTAWRMSWTETRRHFWELLLLKFVAGLIGSLGGYLCYVGLIGTLPIYFTMIAVAYEHRFADDSY